MLKPRITLLVSSLALWAVTSACGIRNLGEACPEGVAGDLLCAPGRCDPKALVCVQCLEDLDCFKDDPLDRPRCMPAIPLSEGGDGLPFCKTFADHPSCGLPGSEVLCTPGQCHPEAGVCVDCLEDKDCPGDRPVCDQGVPPDNLPFCRAKDAE
jgi:hypothetical protein